LQTCAWSPNGAILLFTTDAETVIYAIDFKTDWATNGQGNQVTQSARPVLDVSGGLWRKAGNYERREEGKKEGSEAGRKEREGGKK
jgi:hypothetical protein